MNDTNIHIEDLLKEIYENKRIIEQEKNNILENTSKAEILKKEYEVKYQELLETEKKIIIKAKEEAASILINIKEEANSIIKDIENSNSSKQANMHRDKLNKKISELSNIDTSIKNIEVLKKENLKINQEVFIPRLNQNGIILSINNDSCMVQVGIIKSSFKIKDLAIAHKHSNDKNENLRSIKREFKPISVSSEINVIGQNVDEACFVIDKYLDTCSLNGLNTVRIVHGKGTGRLRNGIHQFLKTHPHVKSFRLGTFGEGETGVTVVELK